MVGVVTVDVYIDDVVGVMVFKLGSRVFRFKEKYRIGMYWNYSWGPMSPVVGRQG